MVRHIFDLGLSPTKYMQAVQLVEHRDSPPPAKLFWNTERYPLIIEGKGTVFVRLELEPPRRLYTISTPTNPQNKYPEIMVSFEYSLKLSPALTSRRRLWRRRRWISALCMTKRP